MPPRKKAAAAPTGKAQVLRTEMVPCKSLKAYHKNPRVGDVDTVAISLEENGQYKPIVVNIGTHTGRKNEILAGNHTWLGARKRVTYSNAAGKVKTKEPYDEILASFVDVDEEQAKKIVLVDNKAADNGTYDDALLAELLEGMEDPLGTGYLDTEVEDILANLPKMDDTTVDELADEAEEYERQAEEEEIRGTFDGAPLGEEPDPALERARERERAKEGQDDRSIDKASDSLPGAFELKDEIPDEYVGFWQIPKIRTDRLVHFDDLPENFETWAGSASKDWPDDETWWLYNWGVDSTSGMKDISKVVMSFYTHDEYFDNLYWFPGKYTTKFLNSGIKQILTPNYSQWSAQPQAMNLWALYRSRWVARYFQEAGMDIIVDINWPLGDIDFLRDYVLATLPKNLPMIAMQMQTYNKDEWEHGEAEQIKHVQLIFDTLEPKGLLLYAGRPGREWFAKNIKTNCDVRVMTTRNEKLSKHAKGRERKKTI